MAHLTLSELQRLQGKMVKLDPRRMPNRMQTMYQKKAKLLEVRKRVVVVHPIGASHAIELSHDCIHSEWVSANGELVRHAPQMLSAVTETTVDDEGRLAYGLKTTKRAAVKALIENVVQRTYGDDVSPMTLEFVAPVEGPAMATPADPEDHQEPEPAPQPQPEQTPQQPSVQPAPAAIQASATPPTSNGEAAYETMQKSRWCLVSPLQRLVWCGSDNRFSGSLDNIDRWTKYDHTAGAHRACTRLQNSDPNVPRDAMVLSYERTIDLLTMPEDKPLPVSPHQAVRPTSLDALLGRLREAKVRVEACRSKVADAERALDEAKNEQERALTYHLSVVDEVQQFKSALDDLLKV
jgi:hypothetical protein